MQTPAKIAALALHEPAKVRLPQTPSEEEVAALRLLNSTRASILDDDWPKKIAAFRRLYSLAQHDRDKPGLLLAPRQRLHGRLLDEEMAETDEAFADNDYVEQVDGVLDLIYVGLGFLLETGLTPANINLLMEEVHASNLTKVDDDGQPIYDEGGKVLKGPNYVKADIRSLLIEMGWQPPELTSHQ